MSTPTAANEAAVRILEGNWTGAYTTPASGLYPHQWSWDSAFIAIGLRHVAPQRARRELDSLFAAQWADGRVPQIVYSTGREDDYQPGAAFWNSPAIPGAAAVPTAGLVQPPNHALAAWLVHSADEAGSRDAGFLERLYPHLVAWHAFLAEARCAPGSGLAAIVHPWESGTDNSPLWDAAMAPLPKVHHAVPRPDLLHADATERPSEKEYGTYYWLAESYRDLACDHRTAAEGEWRFLLEDPSFNALWAASEVALGRIAAELGLESSGHAARAAEITAALADLFVPELGVFAARDVVAGELVRKATVSGLVPLILADLPQADALLATLEGPRFLGNGALMVPSYDATAADHDPAQYWRGPAWFNMTWLIIQGLRAHGRHARADELAGNVQRLAVENNFPEYVDPWTGAPHGTRTFSWTAALAIDLAHGG